MEENDLLDVPHLLYVMDPMCSWCYGFAPVIKKIKEEQQDVTKFKLVMGGLRPGTTALLSEDLKSSIKEHWQHVQEATDQPFDFNFFERDDFVYDTEPACRAVVTLRYLKPEAEFEMAGVVQQAFYANNNDVTKPEVLASIASQFGVQEEEFLEKFNSDLLKEKTQQDFAIARHLKADAFPSVYLLDGTELYLLSRGYRMYEAMQQLVDNALRELNHKK